jgi:hypothetical protein
MPDLEMVPVMMAGDSFEARVIAARLGSEGIVWQLRGNVDGPYPIGEVEVLVDADDYELARALLLADEVEDAFVVAQRDGEVARHAPREVWFLVFAIVAMVVFTFARMFLRAG